MDEETIECLVSVGYDLHIHDLSGRYPDGLDRDEWKKQEINKCLSKREPEDSADVCPCGAPAFIGGWCEECVQYAADDHDPNG